MKVEERKKMVLAMEYVVRHLNDEDDFMGWLMCGVADGDIPQGSMDINDVDDCYIEDSNFQEIMECFLRRMKNAAKDGGLYCDRIFTRGEEV